MPKNYKIHYDDTLSHHGVKGMKWGVRNDPVRTGIRNRAVSVYSNVRNRASSAYSNVRNKISSVDDQKKLFINNV